MNQAKEIDAASVLKLLSDSQKISILRELGKAKDGLSYSEIMHLTGLQSGRLGFHLRGLGTLVEKREERKYQLTSQGAQALGLLGIAEALFPERHSEFKLRDGSTLVVRPTFLEDSHDLFEIEKSRQNAWIKSVLGEVHEARYEELSPEEIAAQCGAEPNLLRELIRKDKEEGVINFTGLIHGRPRASLRLVSMAEPDPWGKAAHAKIDIHKDYDDLGASIKLLQVAVDTARKMGHAKLQVGIFHPLPELEKHLGDKHSERRVDYAYMRVETSRVLEAGTVEGVAIGNAADDPGLFRKLRMNRSMTWANQASDCEGGECFIDPSKPSRDRLLHFDGRSAALAFYHRSFTNSAGPEIYLPYDDWGNEGLIQGFMSASAVVAEELSFQMLEIIVERRFRETFASLGFRDMEPETPTERLLGKEWVGGKGPSFVIDL